MGKTLNKKKSKCIYTRDVDTSGWVFLRYLVVCPLCDIRFIIRTKLVVILIINKEQSG